MKLLLLSIAIIFSFSTFSQVWGRPGATWHYTKSIFGEGYVKVRYVDDMLAGGHYCQHFNAKLYEFLPTNAEGDLFMTTTNMGDWYTYVSGDTVFYKSGDHFDILYNFAAEAGDSWLLQTGDSIFACNDTSSVTVVGNGLINIDGQNLNYLDIEEAEGNSFGVSGRIVSRIGLTGAGFLFPLARNCDPSVIVDFYEYEFRCYEDDEIYYNPNNLYCEYFLNTEENEAPNISIAPNPVNKVLSVGTEPGNHPYEIRSITGQLISKGILGMSENQLDVSALDAGVYYLQVKINDKQGMTRFIKE